MESRHIQMISLGGVIGTGLFLSSGYTIHQAGPLGTVLAYFVGALIVYSVMLCLGELSVAMPYTGSFHVYAKRYINPATGFVVAILYWLTWTIALGSEFTAAGLIMRNWFPHTPVWIWSLLFMIGIVISNIYSFGTDFCGKRVLAGRNQGVCNNCFYRLGIAGNYWRDSAQGLFACSRISEFRQGWLISNWLWRCLHNHADGKLRFFWH